MTKYIIHGVKFFGTITFVFNYDGNIVGFTIEAELTDTQRRAFVGACPCNEAEFLQMAEKSKTIKFTKVPADLSFEFFWNAYENKVGDKTRSEKLWNKLTEAEQTQALKSIPAYNYYLNNKKIAKAYPETWLNQKRFLTNEYK